MTLSKSVIEEIAKQICAPILEKKEAAKIKLEDTFYKIYLKRVSKDKEWQALVNFYATLSGERKEWIDTRTCLSVTANGLNWQNIYAPDGSIFVIKNYYFDTTSEEAAKLKPIFDTIENLQEEYDKTRRELKNAFGALKTDKKIIEAFPEVVAFIPKENNTCVALVQDIAGLRKKIKTLV